MFHFTLWRCCIASKTHTLTRESALEKAERLFGVRNLGELDELVWRFRSILLVLEDWERDEGLDTVTEESAEKEIYE